MVTGEVRRRCRCRCCVEKRSAEVELQLMLNRFQSGDGPYNKSLLCDYKRASCGPSFEALAAGRSKQSVSEGERRGHLVTRFLPPPLLGSQLGDILHRPVTC